MYNRKLHFHFTGIGGSGMSGLAEILVNLGFKISGSDLHKNEACRRLERLGAKIAEGHHAENIPDDASLLVYSSAVSNLNPEMQQAHSRGIPIIRRAEVLAELMRLKYGVAVAGSHGKTTTTSMIAHILEVGGLDPTVIIGGQVKAMNGSGARLGKSDFLVAESDESDRSFLLLKPTVAVVTNIDAEHLDAYESLGEMEESFDRFIQAVPFYGVSVLCVDDPRVRALSDKYQRRRVTFGLSPDADIQARNIKVHHNHTAFDVFERDAYFASISLPLLGVHMASNALAAIAVGKEFGVSREKIVEALNSFSGVRRRLELIGEERGVTVMNDYAHHPTEIKATLKAVRSGWSDAAGKVRVVFQPHRYSRTKSCFAQFLDAFTDCDDLILTDIYSAGEEPIEGINAEKLCEALTHNSKRYVPSLDMLLKEWVNESKPGDIILCLGAGSIGQFPEKIVAALRG